MMTIKQFASLCGCSTQTLRYYDKIDLLKPVQVDRWSGYRYYTESQAIDFVKIRNLQAADFTIGEIKGLLTMEDTQVYAAFERKITEQTRKLERIKEIQQSYLTEMNNMKNLVLSFCDHLMERAYEPAMLAEFGMSREEAAGLVDAIRSLILSRTVESGEEERIVNVVVDEESFEGEEAMEKMTFLVQEEDLGETVYLNADNQVRDLSELTEGTVPVWQTDGWSCTHEFLDRIPALEDGVKYVVLVRHHEKSVCDSLSYPLFMIAALLRRGYGAAADLHCYVDRSVDGQNHFALMRKA